jgi:hypothetical protein
MNVGRMQDKAENPVVKRRPSIPSDGGLWPILDSRVRQPFVAKEPLCGNQPADRSLVIAVFRFPSCFVILPFYFLYSNGRCYIDRNIF